ncbi:MAG: beta strand repeat-containing protein, partial [bacterium]
MRKSKSTTRARAAGTAALQSRGRSATHLCVADGGGFGVQPNIGVAMGLFMAAGQIAAATPDGASVQHGQVSFNQAGSTLNIQQTTPRAIVNWRGFSVGGSETVRFILPSAHSAILNRVTGDQASVINGQITSNGRVYLLNPNGILVGPNGRINTAGVVLSTLDINDDDFIDGRSATLRGNSNNAVINQGIITTTLGDVALIARRVVNEGTIDAPGGTVALAGAGEVVLHPEGASERISIIASSGTVVNAGSIRAVNAELQAVGGNAYALAINNTGVVRAQTVERSGGRILLRARSSTSGEATIANNGQLIADGGNVSMQATGTNPSVISTGVIAAQTAPNGALGSITLLATDAQGKTAGTTAVSGVLDASGRNPGQRGGSITVTGGNVTLLNGARIDVSGDAGGGEVLIGGDYLGGDYRGTLATPDLAADDTAWGNTPGGYSSINGTGLAEYLRRFYDYFRPEGGMPTASRTHVGSDVVVDASAKTSGHGGRVIYWSDHGTSYSGHTDVGAYGTSGHGGFIEVSGRDWLGYNGSFNALAVGGRAGTLLLDPTDMEIRNALDDGVTGASPFNGTGPAMSILNVATLQTALGTGNVIIQSSGGTGGNGDITFVDAVAWNNANSLTVNASRHLMVNNTITNTGTGNITLNANIATTGDLTINNNITTGGSITGLARRNLTLAATRTLTTGAAGALSLQAANGVTTGTGNLNLNGNLSVGTGALTLTSGINGTRPNWTATNTNLVPQSGTFGTVLIQGFQDLTLNRAMSAAGNVTLLAFRDLNLPLGSNITTSAAGSISLRAANANIAGTGNLTLASNLSVANGGNLTLTSGANGTRPNWTATNTNLTVNGGTSFTNITIQGFQDITLNRAINAAGNIGVQAFRDLNLPLGSDITTSAGGSISLQAANANINGTGNLNLASNVSVGLGGNLTLTSGVNGTRPNWTATNTNLTVNGGTNFSNITIQGFQDLTLSRALTTNAAANSITLLAMRDLNIPAGSNITLANAATGAVSLRAAGGNVLGTGNFNLGANLAVGTGALTLLSGSNGTRPDLTLNTTNLSLVTGAANFGSIDIRGFNNTFVNRAITSGGTILVYAFRDLNVNNPIASAVSGWLDLRSANSSTTGTGNLNLGAPLSVGTGGLTLMSGINGTRPDWTATTTNLMQTGATFGPVNIDGFNNFTL